MGKPLFRFIYSICVFLSVCVLPWWISVLIVGVSIFIFPVYIEAIVCALLYDALYSPYFSLYSRNGILVTVFLILTIYAKTFIRR